MTEQQHPITPSPELILKWCRGWNCTAELAVLKGVAVAAAQWGGEVMAELTIRKLLALVEDLEGALLSAADSLEEWGDYVEPHFKVKHAFDADVANARSHAQRARNVINGKDIIGEIDD